jgi:hypothetical protein
MQSTDDGKSDHMLLARLSGTAKEFLGSEIKADVLPEFRKVLLTAGIKICEEPQAKFLISVNHNKHAYKQFIQNGGVVKNAILIRLEPDAVFPKQYTKKIEDKYGLIISPGFVSKTSRFVEWPYRYHLNPAEPKELDPSLLDVLGANLASSLFSIESWNKRENLLSMVASNKVSPVQSANYGKRRKLARTLPVSIFSVYGTLWTDSLRTKARHRVAVLVAALRQGTLPNLRQVYGNLFFDYMTAKGSIEDKHELLKRSKFSLVIENSSQVITEKIFDSMINGCIPIYVGANLKDVDLPTNLAYQLNGNADEILELIENYSIKEIELKLNSISKFLTSANFLDKWSNAKVYEKIGVEISEYILDQASNSLSVN